MILFSIGPQLDKQAANYNFITVSFFIRNAISGALNFNSSSQQFSHPV